MPSIPTSPRASLTSSNLNGFIMASIFFIASIFELRVQATNLHDAGVLQTTRDTRFGKKLLSNPNAKSGKTVEPCPNRLNSKRETEEKENHLHGKPAPF